MVKLKEWWENLESNSWAIFELKAIFEKNIFT